MLTYRDLTGYLMTMFPEELVKDGKKLTNKQVYHRVWRWCQKNGIVPRKPTGKRQDSEAKERTTATRCWGTLNEVARVMEANGVKELSHSRAGLKKMKRST